MIYQLICLSLAHEFEVSGKQFVNDYDKAIGTFCLVTQQEHKVVQSYLTWHVLPGNTTRT